MRLYYKLTTLDPIIVSQNNATTTNHECLDYIPGSAILGTLAGKLYAKLTNQESWQVFHSGVVQFGPCYPLTNQEIALPTPNSWHYEKGEEAFINVDNNTQQYNRKKITNHAAPHFKRDEQKQYKQCRHGYLTSQAQTKPVIQGYSTKTAIKSATGSAEDGQLFSYSYLEAEQSFVGWVNINDELTSHTLQQLKQALNGTVRIGRSRNNEFGRVKLASISLEETAIKSNSEQLIIWCLSDVEMINTLGMPTLAPTGDDIHSELKGIPLNPHKSFIRSNKVSRFNQKRQGLDSEQVLINKGSVLTFDLSKPEHKEKITEQLLTSLATQGIGINKQQGLGWVCINPPWADHSEISSEQSLYSPLKILTTANEELTTDVETADTQLTRWLFDKLNLQKELLGEQHQVNQLINSIISLYKNVRNYHNIINSNEAGPSSNQWRRIADKVRNNNNNWQTGVFVGEHAICKAGNDELGWGITLQGINGQTHFANEIETLLVEQNIYTMRLLVEQLCRYDLSSSEGLNKITPLYQNRQAGSQ